MKDLLFPARKTHRALIHSSGCSDAVEIYTSKDIEMPGLKTLDKVVLLGRNMNHYLAEPSKTSMEDLISHLDLPGAVEKSIMRTEKVREYRPPKIMAVVNATPDSFFRGSRISDMENSLDSIIESCPEIIDVGGESTRPGSYEISVSEEIKRVRPVIDYLLANTEIPISLDTRHSIVLKEFGADLGYVNDVSGFRDPDMIRLALEFGLKCVTMHMRGNPDTMQSMTGYTEVLPEVLAFLLDSAQSLSDAGIASENIYIDPGIGFAKTIQGNLELIKDASSFNVGYGTLFGTSRKSFLGKITGNEVEDRLPETLATTAYLAAEGVDILRVHDPKENGDVVKIISSIIRS